MHGWSINAYFLRELGYNKPNIPPPPPKKKRGGVITLESNANNLLPGTACSVYFVLYLRKIEFYLLTMGYMYMKVSSNLLSCIRYM